MPQNTRTIVRRVIKRLMPTTRYKGLGELDKALERFLPRCGFFVELGANDGIQQSNTYYFEKYKGWTGILIEPVPELFARCVRNRPNAHHFNYACTDPESAAAGELEMTYCNLMSVTKGAFSDKERESYWIESGATMQNVTPHDLRVPSITLSGILASCNNPHVDLLSLDVEGYEIPVLKGLDLTRHKPDVILVETLLTPLNSIQDYLCQHYELAAEISDNDALFRARE
ncbi:MAG: FkbM family methyltransferase [Bryobacteraceae bacterium]